MPPTAASVDRHHVDRHPPERDRRRQGVHAKPDLLRRQDHQVHGGPYAATRTRRPPGRPRSRRRTCARAAVSPTFTADVGSRGHTQPVTSPPVTTRILQDEGEAGLQNAARLLPQIATSTSRRRRTVSVIRVPLERVGVACKSIIGSASAISPVLPASETGLVGIVRRPPAHLPRPGVDLHGPLALQLFAVRVPSAGLGQQFNGLPDIPIPTSPCVSSPATLADQRREPALTAEAGLSGSPSLAGTASPGPAR